MGTIGKRQRGGGGGRGCKRECYGDAKRGRGVADSTMVDLLLSEAGRGEGELFPRASKELAWSLPPLLIPRPVPTKALTQRFKIQNDFNTGVTSSANIFYQWPVYWKDLEWSEMLG